MLRMKFMCILAFILGCCLLGFTSVRAQSDSEVYKDIGILKGEVYFINHAELGRTPASSAYIVFQRVDCKKCLVATTTDLNGRYELSVGKGTYKVIVFQPSPPVYDLLAPHQPRVIKIRSGGSETVFDINLKLRHQPARAFKTKRTSCY